MRLFSSLMLVAAMLAAVAVWVPSAFAQAPADVSSLPTQFLTIEGMRSIFGQTAAILTVMVTVKRIAPMAVQGGLATTLGMLVALLLQMVFVAWGKGTPDYVLAVINALIAYGLASMGADKVASAVGGPPAPPRAGLGAKAPSER